MTAAPIRPYKITRRAEERSVIGRKPATTWHLRRMTAAPVPPYEIQPQGRRAQRHRPQTRHGTAPSADDGFAYSALQNHPQGRRAQRHRPQTRHGTAPTEADRIA